MALPKLTLEFFLQIGDPTDPDTVEAAWRDLSFPLIKTQDFDENWTLSSDGWTIFCDEHGLHRSVRPRPELASKYPDVDATSLYPSIVFSKILYAVSRMAFHNQGVLIAENKVISDQIFADKYLVHLPPGWKTAVVKYNLQHYSEMAEVKLAVPFGLQGPLSQPSNIRLLVLLPCPPGEQHLDISCLLGEVDFNACQPYEALSYVWGDSRIRRSIMVNKQRIEVTENLENALRALRKSTGEIRTLWVDALCINQSDDTEKMEQVAQMDKIYKRAKHVLVWLGKETTSSQVVFQVLNHIKRDWKGSDEPPTWFPQHFPLMQEAHCAQCARSPLKMNFKPLWNDSRFAQMCEYHEMDSSKIDQTLQQIALIPEFLQDDEMVAVVEAFTQVISFPWWERVWVVQEFVLAPQAKLLCGQEVVDWRIFRAVLLMLVRIGQRSGRAYGVLGTTSRQHQAFYNLVDKAFQILPFILLWGVSNQKSAAVEKFCPSLPNLLALSLTFKATNPRDYVYSLLGVLPSDSKEREQISPNYTRTVSDVYIDIAKTYLIHSKTLDVLAGMHPCAAVGSTLRLPSWVPDWSSRDPSLPTYSTISLTGFSPHKALATLLQTQYKIGLGNEKNDIDESQAVEEEELWDDIFCATGSSVSPSSVEFAQHGEHAVLQVRGLVVDEVEIIGRWLYDLFINGESLEALYAETFDDWKTICDPSETTLYMYTDQYRKEAFWRTVMMNRHWKRTGSRFQGKDIIKMLPADLRTIETSEIFGHRVPKPSTFPPQSADDESQLRHYIHVNHNQRVLYNRLSCHCHSFCMFRTKQGYMGLCQPSVGPGDKVVILLGGQSPFILRRYQNHHVLMGECYVHGIMHGEFIEHMRQNSNGTDVEYEAFDLM